MINACIWHFITFICCSFASFSLPLHLPHLIVYGVILLLSAAVIQSTSFMKHLHANDCCCCCPIKHFWLTFRYMSNVQLLHTKNNNNNNHDERSKLSFVGWIQCVSRSVGSCTVFVVALSCPVCSVHVSYMFTYVIVMQYRFFRLLSCEFVNCNIFGTG